MNKNTNCSDGEITVDVEGNSGTTIVHQEEALDLNIDGNHIMETSSSQLASKKRRANGPLLREEKQKRWLAKQSKLEQRKENQIYRQKWIEQHSDMCHKVSLRDVQLIKNADNLSQQWTEFLRPYFDLKSNHGGKDKFIAEGLETVRVLMKQVNESKCPVKLCSVLVKPGAFFGEHNSNSGLLNHWLECEERQRPQVLVVDDDKVFDEIAGFPVARGAMACGIPRRIEWKDLWPSNTEKFSAFSYLLDPCPRSCKRFVALDGVSNSGNMGSIIRCSAAFGIDAIFVTDDCCDAWYRQSVRVSMGYIAKVPIIEVSKKMLALVLSKLKDCGITCYAASSQEGAKQLSLEELRKDDIPSQWCCVFGNEANGIQPLVMEACSYSIRIKMVDGVDSLSVSVAAGILLHGFLDKAKGK